MEFPVVHRIGVLSTVISGIYDPLFVRSLLLVVTKCLIWCLSPARSGSGSKGFHDSTAKSLLASSCYSTTIWTTHVATWGWTGQGDQVWVPWDL